MFPIDLASSKDKKPAKRRRFSERLNHELTYGLLITKRDAKTHEVAEASCQFCLVFGREKGPNDKRKKRKTVASWTNFRVDHYIRHHEKCHPRRWARYKKLEKESKRRHFCTAVEVVDTSQIHFDSKKMILLRFGKKIVDTVLKQLLFRKDSEAESVEMAFADFVWREASTRYEVVIENKKQFSLILSLLASGCTFRASSKIANIFKVATKLAHLHGASKNLCSFYARVCCAYSLQLLSEKLRNCWTFSIGLQCEKKQQTCLLIKIRLYDETHSDILSLHLVALPAFTSKEPQVLYKLISSLLDVLCFNWKDKLLSISVGGEPSLMEESRALQRLLENECIYPVYRDWCALQQLELAFQHALNENLSPDFLNVLNSLIAFCRNRFKKDLDLVCPKSIQKRWTTLHKIVRWVLRRRQVIRKLFEDSRSTNGPLPSWWIQLSCLSRVLSVLHRSFVGLQGADLLAEQQSAQLGMLADELKELIAVSHRHESEEEYGLSQVKEDDYFIRDADSDLFIENQGTFVLDNYDEMELVGKEETRQQFATLLLSLFLKVKKVKMLGKGEDYHVEPRTTPLELLKMTSGELARILSRQKGRLRTARWSEEKVELVAAEHQNLKESYRKEGSFQKAIDETAGAKSFEEAWAPTKKLLPHLQEFFGGLATVLSIAARDEPPFSLLSMDTTEQTEGLTNFVLSGMLHAKQLHMLGILNQF